MKDERITDIRERLSLAGDNLKKAEKENETRRKALVSSACSDMRTALEESVIILFEREKDFKKRTLGERINLLGNSGKISRIDMYNLDKIRKQGNIAVHEPDKSIDIEEAKKNLYFLVDFIDRAVIKREKILFRGIKSRYETFAFFIFAVMVTGVVLLIIEETWRLYVMAGTATIFGLLLLSLFKLAPRKHCLIVSKPSWKTFVIIFLMSLFVLVGYFVLEKYLGLYYTLGISFVVGMVPYFALIVYYCKRE